MNGPRLPVAPSLQDVPFKVVLAAELLVAPVARVRLESGVRVHMSGECALVGASRRALGACESVALGVDHAPVPLQARLELEQLATVITSKVTALRQNTRFAYELQRE